MSRLTVIIIPLHKGRLNKDAFLLFLLITLAVTVINSVSGAALVSGGTVTEATLQNTQPMTTKNEIENLDTSSEKDSNHLMANQSDPVIEEDMQTESSSIVEVVEDSQAEGDSSHDEAYNSIIANYYTADPFFEGSKESEKSSGLQKYRKVVLSEKHKNGKLRHKIRVKSKKILRPEQMQYTNKPLNRITDGPRKSQIPIQHSHGANKISPSRKPIVKSLPSRRSFNNLKKKRPRPGKPYNIQQEARNSKGFMASKNANLNHPNSFGYNKNEDNRQPSFSDQNAFPPDDGWGKESFYPSNAYPSPYKRRPDSPNPRPEEISQMPKIRIKQMKSRNKLDKDVSPDIEKRHDLDTRMDEDRKNGGKEIDPYLEENTLGAQVATERQSFSELLLGEDSDKTSKGNKRIKPKIRSKGRPLNLGQGKRKNQKSNSKFNFKEGSAFPGDIEGNIPLLPDIEGGNDPFSFLGKEGFGGPPVIAGHPGGPESQSYFEIMNDFFDEPKIKFPPPPPPPKAVNHGLEPKEIHLPKHRYEENDIFEPFDFSGPDFSNHFEGENRELPDLYLPHPAHLESFVNEGPKPEEFVDKHHYSHEPFQDQFKPTKAFHHPLSPPSHYHKNKLSLEVPHPHYPPLKKEYYHVKETESFTKNVQGFVPQHNYIKRPFEDDSYFHTTNKGHPYAEPLNYHNPLDYSYDPGQVEEFEIKKLPALNDYHHGYKGHHTPPVVHELPRLKHQKHYDPPPIYHAKPDLPYNKHSSFKQQSPYAFNLVSKKKPNTPYYDDYKDVKFSAPFKRQTNNNTKERRTSARLLKNPESLILPDTGFIDIPKLGFAEEMGFSDNPQLSPPSEFQIPEFLARSLSDDLDLQYGLFDEGNKDDSELIDRRDKKKSEIKTPKVEDVTEFAPDDRWLQRSIDVPNASFEEEYEPYNETEMDYRRNDINLTPQPYKEDSLAYDYNMYNDGDDDIVSMPILPPPPEMLKMTAGSSFLPIDVPKLGSRIPYQPPELVFDEFYKKTENQFTSSIKEMFNSNTATSRRNKDTNRKSRMDSPPEITSRRNDDETLFTSRTLPFEEEIAGIYAMEQNKHGFDFDETSHHRSFDDRIDEPNYDYNNIQGFSDEINDFLPAFDIQKTISNRYDEGSKIDSLNSKEFSSNPSYAHQPMEYISPNEYPKDVIETPQNPQSRRERLVSESKENKLSFSNLINHPLNEVEIPSYTTYDPMEFKFRKERELNLQHQSRSHSENSYLNPSKFQSRSLNVAASATEQLTDELDMSSRSLPEQEYWNTGPIEEETQGTNRRSLNYGRSLGDGPIPAVLPPPPHVGPNFEQTGKPAVDSHQFIHVKDWDKFKAGHGRGNEYHNIHDVQARDGPQHKEAVSHLY